MKKILTALLLILSITTAGAIQEDKKIDLKSAIELALKTNPQIQLSRLDIDIAQNKVKSSNRLQNPSLEFFQNIPKAGNGNPQTIGLDYTIELFKRKNRKEAAKSYSKAVTSSEKFLEYVLIAEVKKSYIDLLVKKSHLKILNEQKELAQELYNTIKTEADRNALPRTEAIQAKIAVNRAQMAVNNAKSEVISAQNYFNSVMNTSDINYDTKEDFLSDGYFALFAVPPEVPLPSFEKIKNYALSNRYDLKMAQDEITSGQMALQAAKNLRIPDLSLNGGYAYQTKGMSEQGHFQSGGYVGASLVNIPVLYNFRPEIQNAEIEVEKAKLKYKDMEIDALRNLTDAFEKFTIARENLIFYKEKLLPDSRELISASKKSLDNKEIDFTTYLVSKRLYLELTLGYQDTLGEYYTSFAELLKEINSNGLDIENI